MTNPEAALIASAKAKNELREVLKSGHGCEEEHQEADDILCRLLRELGYVEVVDLYHQVPKWYA